MKREITNRGAQNSLNAMRALLLISAMVAMIVGGGCGSAGGGRSGSSGGSGSGSGGGSGSGSGGSGGGSGGSSNSGVVITPDGANVRMGSSKTFTATVTGAPNNDVNWSVDDTVGGDAASGTISAAGVYSSPAKLPDPNTVTVKAVSTSDSSISGSVIVDLLNPVPTLNSIQPSSINTGAFSITVTGNAFVSGSQVMLAGMPLSTAFNSSKQLTATGTASSPGTFAVNVMNPEPGSSTSGAVNLVVNGTVNSSACSAMSLGQGASLNGFLPFPADNLWNTDISGAQVDPNSEAIINFIGPGATIHADFGAGQFDGSIIGIPYEVVGGSQPLVPIAFTDFGDESDPGPMPVPANAQIEGDPNPGNGDRHVLVLDNSNCWLYELYSSFPNGDGSWNAASAAVWDLQNDEQRPYTWTSADAAGLSIFAGLVRYDEVAAGDIKHAIRVTFSQSRAAFVLPATHWASSSSNVNAPPMGMRLRLKSNFDISGFSAANQVILKALKKYGLINADNGSSMFISGAPDDRWDNDDLHLLGGIAASNFEVVKMGTVFTASNLPQGAAPAINSFTASSSSVSAGTPVILNWATSASSYLIVSPGVGAVRGTSATVTPSQTTTYTLYATNAFGRNTATVTITVH